MINFVNLQIELFYYENKYKTEKNRLKKYHYWRNIKILKRLLEVKE